MIHWTFNFLPLINHQLNDSSACFTDECWEGTERPAAPQMPIKNSKRTLEHCGNALGRFFSFSQRSSPSVYRFHILPVSSRKRNCRDVSQKVNQSKLNPGSKSRSTLSFCDRSRFRKGRKRKKYLRRKRAESFSLHEKGKQKSDHYNRSWLLPVCRRAKRSLQGSSNEAQQTINTTNANKT